MCNVQKHAVVHCCDGLYGLVQVVRRRAVPREVGPPPGGPTLVHTQIPVVFFTQSGVPGEVTDVLASSHGPVDVCTQAMAHIGQHNAQICHNLPHAACSQHGCSSAQTVMHKGRCCGRSNCSETCTSLALLHILFWVPGISH